MIDPRLHREPKTAARSLTKFCKLLETTAYGNTPLIQIQPPANQPVQPDGTGNVILQVYFCPVIVVQNSPYYFEGHVMRTDSDDSSDDPASSYQPTFPVGQTCARHGIVSFGPQPGLGQPQYAVGVTFYYQPWGGSPQIVATSSLLVEITS
jgi:hypothetical protein